MACNHPFHCILGVTQLNKRKVVFMRTYIRLTRQERYYIYLWYYKQKISLRQIAIRLNRTPKTVYDEVKNNRRRPDVSLEKFPYEPEYANWLAAQKRHDRKYGKIQTKSGTLNRVKRAIVEKHWTIPMIAHAMKNVPSAATLYRYLKRGVVQLQDYQKHKYHVKPIPLREVMKTNKESDFVHEHSIDQRPDAINHRHSFGHWEMDCIDSPVGVKAALLVFVERKTRYVELIKLSNKQGSQVGLAVKQFLDRHVDEVHSITTDRGHEFINFQVLSALDRQNVAVYFTHPYSPSEKGSIERTNRDIRRYFPKGHSFYKVTPAAIQHVQDVVNRYPREVLNWQSPLYTYRQVLAARKHRRLKRQLKQGGQRN